MSTIEKGLASLGSLVHSAFVSKEESKSQIETTVNEVAITVIENSVEESTALSGQSTPDISSKTVVVSKQLDETIESVLNEFKEKIDIGFERVNKRLDALEEQVSQLEQNLQKSVPVCGPCVDGEGSHSTHSAQEKEDTTDVDIKTNHSPTNVKGEQNSHED